MRKAGYGLAAAIGLGLGLAGPAAAENLAIIYQDGQAVVQQNLLLPLEAGRNDVAIDPLVKGADPDTIQITIDPNLKNAPALRSLLYRQGRADNTQPIAAFLGKVVTAQPIWPGHGKHHRADHANDSPSENPEAAEQPAITGRLQAVADGYFWLVTDESPAQSLVLPMARYQLQLPEAPLASISPSLSAVVESKKAGNFPATLDYLVQGLRWQVDYNLDIPADAGSQAQATLSSYVSLHNDQPATAIDEPVIFERLFLAAGRFNRQKAIAPENARLRQFAATSSDQLTVTSEEDQDYSIYVMNDGPYLLQPGAVSRYPLFSGFTLPIQRQLVYRGWGSIYGPDHYQKGIYSYPERRISWQWPEKLTDQLGPLVPAGTLHIKDQDGMTGVGVIVSDQALATSNIGTDQEVVAGQARDISVERWLTDFSRTLQGNQNEIQAAHHLVLRNHGKRKAAVVIEETMQGEWEIISASAPHQREGASLARWRLDVPAGGEVTLDYRLRFQP